MAEYVGCEPLFGTSDELRHPFCEPCCKNGTNRSAAGYCPKCWEFYCQRCLAAHRRMAATERHKILLEPDMPACLADKPVKYQLCDKRDGESKCIYCFDHGITICGICFIGEHKRCQVKEVSESCKSFNISAEKTSFTADVGLLFNRVKEASKSIKSNKARLEKEQQDILTEAQKQINQLLEKANQSYQDFSGEVTSLFQDHTFALFACQSTLDEIASKVDTILQSLQQSGPKKQNDQKEFLELLYSAEKVRLCEEKIKQLNLKHIDINCTLNTNIQPLILKKNKFGELSLQTETFKYNTELPSIHYPYVEPRQDPAKTVSGSGAMGGHAVQSVKLTPLDKINVKIPDDKDDCWISGVDITVDENMLLVDNKNYKVKLFTPDGKLLSSLKPPDKPIDVAVINKSEAAVSTVGKQIGIIAIADSGHLSMKRIITTEQYLWGITTYNNNLIVTCDTSTESPHSVQIIDMRGQIVWTTTTDSEGKTLFDFARNVTTYSGDASDNVIVTDRKKQAITVLDAGTGKVVKVCDVRGKEPHGLTVDDNGNVYVCYKSGEISIWSRGMQEETRLTTRSKDLLYPWAMAYSSSRSELVLTGSATSTEYYDFIHRYKISIKRSRGQKFFDKVNVLKKIMLA